MVSPRAPGFFALSPWRSLGCLRRVGLGLGLATALVACGDDSGSGEATAADESTDATTQSADDGSVPGTTTGASGATGSGDSTGDAAEGTTTAADGSTAGSSGGSGTGDTGGSDTGGTGSDTGDASSSSSGGMTGIPACDECEVDEVCVAYQAQQTMYECHPLPAGCAGDVDCECGDSLCEDPYVGCSDPAEPNMLHCACIAC